MQLTHLVRKVGGPVQVGVMGDLVAAKVRVPVDEGCNAWELGNEVHRVLVDGVPVVLLGGTLCVRLGKAALRLQGQVHSFSAPLAVPPSSQHLVFTDISWLAVRGAEGLLLVGLFWLNDKALPLLSMRNPAAT